MTFASEIHRIRDLAVSCTNDKTNLLEKLSHLQEEVGEVAKAIRQELGLKEGKPSEPCYMECIDVVNNALDIYFSTGGTLEDLGKNLKKKTDKWEAKYGNDRTNR